MVAFGSVEIGKFDAGWVESSGGAEGGDDGDFSFAASCEKLAFVSDEVDGIDDAVEGRGEELVDRFRITADGAGFDFSGWVDVADAGGHHFGFCKADGRVEGGELAVDVGEADLIEVDQFEMADAASGERFGSKTSDAAEAYDEDVGGLESFEGGGADQFDEPFKRRNRQGFGPVKDDEEIKA